MKKKVLVIICVVMSALLLCSCSGGTELFGSRGTSPFVKLGDYKTSAIDQNSKEYKEYYDVQYFSDVSTKDLYERVDEGKVEMGNYANIDFIGTIDDVAFEGGTDQNYDLLIGSGSFIEGFEEGLIGVSVGETKNLHLTFPENYQNEEYAGKAAVFIVTVNYRKVPSTIDKAYSEMGFNSVEEYENDLNERCIKYFSVKNLVNCCTFKETPDKDLFTGVVMLAVYDEYCRSAYNKDIKTYLTGTGQNVNVFAQGLVDHMADNQLDGVSEIKTVKNGLLAFYALYEKEGFSYDEEKLGKTTSYERAFDEFMIIKDLVSDYLYKNIQVKKADD